MSGNRGYFKLGTHNAVCYVCGFKRKADEMLLRWDGVYVCKEDWEIRQPQDFVRGLPEETAPPWTQSESPPVLQSSAEPLTNIVVGTPSIYVNGNLMTSGVDYTISLPEGIVTFTVAPTANSIIAWSGTWLDNANTQTTYTQYPLYQATGFTTVYNIYGVN